MMRKAVAVLGGLILLTAVDVDWARAGATLTGETGLATVPTADVLKSNHYRIGIYGNGEIETDTDQAGDQDLDRIDFSIAYGIPYLDGLEIYAHIPLVFVGRNTRGVEDATSNGGLRLGLKYALLHEGEHSPISLALLGDVVVGIGSDSLPVILDRSTAFGRRETYEVMAIMDRTLFTMPCSKPAVLTLNAGGLFFDNPARFSLSNQSQEFRRRFKGTNPTFTTPFEFAAAVNAPVVSGSYGELAWLEEFRGNTGTVKQLHGSIPMQLFSGVRYQVPTWIGLTFQAGLDVALSGYLDPYRFTAGMTWQTLEPKPLPPPPPPPPPAPPAPPPPPPVKKKIVLRGVRFDFDKAVIRPDSTPTLDEAAATLKEHREILVVVEGHTDGQGTDEYNQKLSLRRATAVRDYLRRKGVEAGRMTVVGKGKSEPVATNDTEDGRAQNRRVALVVE